MALREERVLAAITHHPDTPAFVGTYAVSSREMRQSNLTHLLTVLRSAEQLSRTELATRTGVTVPTVHRLIADLVELGLVCESEMPRQSAGVGRRPMWYSFNAHAATVASVDIGNETTRAALADASGTILGTTMIDTAAIAGCLPREIGALLASLQAERAKDVGLLAAVAIGISASIDPDTGTVMRAPIYRQWKDIALSDLLKERLHYHVVVEQDDHLSAVAELGQRGAARNAQSAVIVNVGKGIGAACIVNRQVVRGSHGASGRIATWPLSLSAHDPTRTLDNMLVSDAMVSKYRQGGGTGSVHDGKSLCTVARAGDPVAGVVVKETAIAMGRIVLTLAALMDPEIMILGGGLAGSFDLFEPAIREALSVLPRQIPVIHSGIGTDAVALGGIAVALGNLQMWLQDKLRVA